MQQCEDWAVYQRLAGVEGVTSSRPIAAIACWLNPGADYCFVTHVRKVERWRAATVRLASSRARAGNTRSCGPSSKAPAAARRPRPSWPKPETNPQQSSPSTISPRLAGRACCATADCRSAGTWSSWVLVTPQTALPLTSVRCPMVLIRRASVQLLKSR